MNNFDQQDTEAEIEDEERIQITNLDSEGSPQSRRAEQMLTIVLKSLAKPWLRYSLSGLLLLILLGALFLQLHQSAPATSIPISLPPATSASPILNAAAANNRLYLQGNDDTVTAYQVTNGRVLWSKKLPGPADLQATDQSLYCYFVTAQHMGVLEALSASTGRVIWSDAEPVGNLGPLSLQSSGDTLYVNGLANTLYAIQASDGYLLWTHSADNQAQVNVQHGVVEISLSDQTVHILNASNGREIIHLQASGANSFPQIDGQLLYVLPSPGDLSVGQTIQVFHLPDGKLLWTFPLPNGAGVITEQDSVVYLGSLDGSSLTALRGSDGHPFWTYKTHTNGANVNLLIEKDGRVYLLLQDDTLVSIRASDGQGIWSTQIKAFSSLGIQVSPLEPFFDQGVILLSNQSPLNGPGASSNLVYALRASDGMILWHTLVPTGEASSLSGTFYVMQESGQLDAWRESDGKHLWRYQAPPASTSLLGSSLLGNTPAMLVLVNKQGRIEALRSSDGKLLWHYPAT
jgi:outer membrane protein assembly factor BamB